MTLCACSKSELGGGNVRKPQKYTYSQHGNKCFKEEIRSLSKVGFVSKDKASFVRKDTTGTWKRYTYSQHLPNTHPPSFSENHAQNPCLKVQKLVRKIRPFWWRHPSLILKYFYWLIFHPYLPSWEKWWLEVAINSPFIIWAINAYCWLYRVWWFEFFIVREYWDSNAMWGFS